MGMLMALWCGWVGARFGTWMRTLGDQPYSEATVNPRMLWLGAGVLAAFAACTALYMVTATPPTG